MGKARQSKSGALTDLCPCGSERRFHLCCGPYLTGDMLPQTAEALMRSRFVAYGIGETDYLLKTWHPSTRPESLDLEEDPIKWLSLSVGETTGGNRGDSNGTVHFVARYKFMGRAGKLVETSRFVCEGGCWFYVDGDISE